jgi:hypothetical protein
MAIGLANLTVVRSSPISAILWSGPTSTTITQQFSSVSSEITTTPAPYFNTGDLYPPSHVRGYVNYLSVLPTQIWEYLTYNSPINAGNSYTYDEPPQSTSGTHSSESWDAVTHPPSTISRLASPIKTFNIAIAHAPRTLALSAGISHPSSLPF